MLSRLIAQGQKQFSLDDTIARVGLTMMLTPRWRLVRTHLCPSAAEEVKLRLQVRMPHTMIHLETRKLSVTGLRSPIRHVALYVHGTHHDATQARQVATDINIGYLKGQIDGA